MGYWVVRSPRPSQTGLGPTIKQLFRGVGGLADA
jgi:hypothetical protein